MSVEYRWLDVNDLQISPAYQRRIHRGVVHRIKEEFDPSILGCLIVGERQDGSYWVIDGQQRLTALRELGHKTAPCWVQPSNGSTHEAALFRGINGGRKNITANELFVAALEAGDVQCVAIKAAVERCGFVLKFRAGGGLRGYNQLPSVTPFMRMYNAVKGTSLIERVLNVIEAAWNKEPLPQKTIIFDGISRFFRKYPEADDKRVVKVLKDLSPDVIYRHADDAKLLMGGNRELVVCNSIVRLYNKRLSLIKQLGVSEQQ